jgi:hypothetical protein
MKHRKVCSFLLLAVAFSAIAVRGQVVAVSQEPMKPYYLNPDGELRARGVSYKDPSSYTSTYILAYPGPPGAIQGFGAMETKAAQQFNFPSINFVFSAAAKMITDNLEPGKYDGKGDTHTELRKLHVNIRVRGLDVNKRPLILSKAQAALVEKEPQITIPEQIVPEESTYVLVLGISPTESQYKTDITATSKGTEPLVSIFDSFLSPMRGLATGVTTVFKNFVGRKDTPTQIAYMSSENEFGWVWRDTQDFGIEGLHQCSAFFRVRKEVAHLQVHIDFIADWRRFGAWVKPADYLVTLTQETIAP